MAYPVSIFQMNKNHHIVQNGTGSPYFDWVGLVIVIIIGLVFLHKFYTYIKESKTVSDGEK